MKPGFVSKRSASLLVSLANGLSLMRLFAVPVIVFLIWRTPEADSFRYAALWLVGCLHAGDMIDGYLARKGCQRLAVRNHFGEMIDPIADKMYVGAAYCTLALTDQFPTWFAALVILRDSAIISGWTFVFKRYNVRLLPNRLGKVTDAGLVVLLGAVLLQLNEALLGLMTPVAAGLILSSGYSYSQMAMRAVSLASFRRLRTLAATRRNRAAGNRISSAS